MIMKFIFFFIILLHVAPLFQDVENCLIDNRDYISNSTGSLNSILPDYRLSDKVRGKDFVLCTYGHNGLMWSIIMKDNDKIIEYHGNTREEIIDSYDSIEYNINDILLNNIELIQWGIDSLPMESKNITPIVNNEYNPVYCNLKVYNKNGDCVFSDINSKSYDGTGDCQFKKKYNNLKYLMIWLSSPDLHEYLPDPTDNP